MYFNQENYLHYVTQLEKKAERIVMWTTFRWIAVAVALVVLATRFMKQDEFVVALVVAFIVALIFGLAAGESKALEVRAEAQRMLCMLAQLHVVQEVRDVDRLAVKPAGELPNGPLLVRD